MDAVQNVRAFLQTAQLGSFTAAARSLGTAPSVITKRIAQLEHQLGVTLFHRSTRRVVPTSEGERLLPRCLRLIGAFDELVGGPDLCTISGRLRVRSPGTMTALLLGPIYCAFMKQHPAVELELQLVDRLSNPIEEGADIAIGTHSSSYPDVIDVPLVPYPCMVCASPAYLEASGVPTHPRDLATHQCLVSRLSTTFWRFDGPAGVVAVEVRPRLFVNDAGVLREAARQGLGVAILPTFMARHDIEQGHLLPLCADFVPMRLWLKALVPVSRMASPTVSAMLAFLKERLQRSELGTAVALETAPLGVGPPPFARSLAASPAR